MPEDLNEIANFAPLSASHPIEATDVTFGKIDRWLGSRTEAGGNARPV